MVKQFSPLGNFAGQGCSAVPADRREVIQIPDPMFADVHNEGMNGLLLWMVADGALWGVALDMCGLGVLPAGDLGGERGYRLGELVGPLGVGDVPGTRELDEAGVGQGAGQGGGDGA